MELINNNFKDSYFELPREKAIKVGIENLADYELLALILNTGNRNENVIELSMRLMSEKGTLLAISRCDISSIKTYGINISKAYSLLATFEIAKRIQKENVIINYDKAIEISNLNKVKEKVEKSAILYLDADKKLLHKQEITSNNRNYVTFPIKMILKNSIKFQCKYIYLLHNHPSGNILPSNEDIISTKRLKKMLETIQVLLLDSIIVYQNQTFSLRREHLI